MGRKSRTRSPPVSGIAALSNLLLLGGVVLVASVALDEVEEQLRQDAASNLETVLDMTHRSVQVWVADRSHYVESLAESPVVSSGTQRQLARPRERRALLASPELTELRRFFLSLPDRHGVSGFLVIAPDGTTVAALRDELIGQTSELKQERPEAFERALAGEAVLVPPAYSDAQLVDTHGRHQTPRPTMFFAAPIPGEQGGTIAVLALRIDPAELSALTELGRLGETGETYALDQSGRLLTESRFRSELWEAGLVERGRTSILSLRIADPGGDLLAGFEPTTPAEDRPLTVAARSAIAGRDGTDAVGYRDYRGEEVLGAWTWSDELGIGLIAETNVEDALQPFFATRATVVLLLVVTVAFAMVLTWLVVWVRRRAGFALRDREARLTAVLDTAIDAIITIDHRGTVETFNAAGERMFGYDADEVIGKNVKMLMGAEDADRHDGYLARYVKTGEARILGIGRELQGRRKDGSLFPLELGVAEMRDVATGEAGFTGVLRDLTDRKRLEVQFLHSQKMEAVGQLAAGVAHDFNNLLMGVSGCATLATSKLSMDDPVRPYLDEIRETAQSGAAITRQLLALSRKRDSRLHVIGVDRVIERSEGMLRRLLGEDVQLEVETRAPNAGVRCGDGQIEQIVMNLVVNARDAMLGGGRIAISTATRHAERPGEKRPRYYRKPEFVVLRVEDSGRGMDEHTRKRIFEPFFTTKEMGKGTGLGLSTVYGIVQQMGGRIEVRSAPDEGTTFTLWLPYAERTTEAAPPEPPPQRRGHGAVVLLVEDEPLVRMTVRDYLESAGYQVLEAGDAKEARALVQRRGQKLRAIVSDAVLPGTSGPMLVKEICAAHPHVRAVLMSAHPAEILRESGHLGDEEDPLLKPFSRETLLERLERVLAPAAAAPTEDEGAEDLDGDRQGILLVEDHDTSRRATAELLAESGFRVLSAGDGAEAVRLYEANRTGVSVVVMDLGLPDTTPEDLLSRMGEIGPVDRVVYISGRDRSDPQVQRLLARPGTDFLAKPVDFEALEELIRAHP